MRKKIKSEEKKRRKGRGKRKKRDKRGKKKGGDERKEKGEKRELGYIQRKFAYGLNTKELSKNKFELRFASYKYLPLYLSQTNSENKYQVTVTVNGKTILISRLFVRIEGGSFWLPNVKYALVEGIELATGKNVTEKIAIK